MTLILAGTLAVVVSAAPFPDVPRVTRATGLPRYWPTCFHLRTESLSDCYDRAGGAFQVLSPDSPVSAVRSESDLLVRSEAGPWVLPVTPRSKHHRPLQRHHGPTTRRRLRDRLG
jgi:hypothetical protein